jgi:transcriptional activator of cad operon
MTPRCYNLELPVTLEKQVLRQQMDRLTTSRLRIGDWNVDPDSGAIARNGDTVRLDLRSMRLLMCLAERAGQVVSIDELISSVWAGVAVSPDSVYQAVTALRRQLGDDSRKPAYIETVPRLGYRMIAKTSPRVEEPPQGATSESAMLQNTSSADAGSGHTRLTSKTLWMAVAVLIAIGFGFVLHARLSGGNRSAAASVAPPAASVGVLPFLDLTEGMRDEEFADGMTEELIDKLSKVQGVRVPSATASFYYKGKALPVAEIAQGLRVTYLLDGSVRKSSGRVRIAARLVRGDNSYVIWTNTYDRPMSDLIMVQDEIAGEVVKALESTVGAAQTHDKSH